MDRRGKDRRRHVVVKDKGASSGIVMPTATGFKMGGVNVVPAEAPIFGREAVVEAPELEVAAAQNKPDPEVNVILDPTKAGRIVAGSRRNLVVKVTTGFFGAAVGRNYVKKPAALPSLPEGEAVSEGLELMLQGDKTTILQEWKSYLARLNKAVIRSSGVNYGKSNDWHNDTLAAFSKYESDESLQPAYEELQECVNNITRIRKKFIDIKKKIFFEHLEKMDERYEAFARGEIALSEAKNDDDYKVVTYFIKSNGRFLDNRDEEEISDIREKYREENAKLELFGEFFGKLEDVAKDCKESQMQKNTELFELGLLNDKIGQEGDKLRLLSSMSDVNGRVIVRAVEFYKKKQKEMKIELKKMKEEYQKQGVAFTADYGTVIEKEREATAAAVARFEKMQEDFSSLKDNLIGIDSHYKGWRDSTRLECGNSLRDYKSRNVDELKQYATMFSDSVLNEEVTAGDSEGVKSIKRRYVDYKIMEKEHELKKSEIKFEVEYKKLILSALEQQAQEVISYIDHFKTMSADLQNYDLNVDFAKKEREKIESRAEVVSASSPSAQVKPDVMVFVASSVVQSSMQ